MTEKRLSLGINVSILLILTIFGILLSLPLRLLLNTNYDAQSNEGKENEDDKIRLSNEARNRDTFESLIEYRKLKQCRRHRFEDRVRSIFYCDYDENCEYATVSTLKEEKEEEEEARGSLRVLEEEVQREEKKGGSRIEQGRKENRRDGSVDVDVKKDRKKDEDDDDDGDDDEEPQESKEIVVAGYILVTMLLVSAIAALVEVLRIRFSKDKSKRLKGRISLTKE